MRLLIKYKLFGKDVEDEFFDDPRKAIARARRLHTTYHGQFVFGSIYDVDDRKDILDKRKFDKLPKS